MKKALYTFIILLAALHSAYAAPPTRGPTRVPTRGPTRSPTRSPTRRPTPRPTSWPTPRPTSWPTSYPTISFADTDSYELFALVGGSQCAEQLNYGPSTISTDTSGYYLSTNTLYGSYAHDKWLQIVTSDGINELFRIYWEFSSQKSVANRFIDATISGVNVFYRVVDTTGVNGSPHTEYTYSGTWYFSKTSSITASKFTVTSTTTGFSADDGCWGAGTGNLDANGVSSLSNFWGIANFDSSDSVCQNIWVNGAVYSSAYPNSKTFMYITIDSVLDKDMASMKPSVLPTLVPSLPRPTVVPSIAPTATRVPTTESSTNAVLFAVVGGSQCAEALYYGPSSISTSGSSDGFAYYLSTSTTSGNTPHTEWLQIVTSDGNTELFRIYWTFATPRTLANRFATAVSTGESVAYVVVDTAGLAGQGSGKAFSYPSSIWQFSNAAGITSSKFTNTFSSVGFSADDGCWGAGTGTLNANGVNTLSNFWGIANFDSSDSVCQNIWVNGAVHSTAYTNGKTYMYIIDTASKPTLSPTLSPSSTSAPTISSSTISLPNELYAVVGGNACAETLPYGTATLTEAGSSDGKSFYFSTSTLTGKAPHTEWLQIVTSGSSGELFRIYWKFATAKTLEDRFVSAVASGESVSYRVVDTMGIYNGNPGTEYIYSGPGVVWWFSNTAGITSSRFTSVGTFSGFSQDDGLWGAGSSVVNGNGASSVANFWGVGNADSTDSTSCSKIFVNGAVNSEYQDAKSYMYIVTSSVQSVGLPSFSPTRVPSVRATPATMTPSTRKPSERPSFRPTVRPSTTKAPTKRPTAAPSAQAAPIVTVGTSIYLDTPSASSNVLSTADQQILINTTAIILQVPASDVEIVSTQYLLLNRASAKKEAIQASGKTLVVSMKIKYNTIDYPQYATSPQSVYNDVTATLTNSITSSTFTQVLRAQTSASPSSSSAVWSSASAHSVSTTVDSIQYPPTKQPTSASASEKIDAFFSPLVIMIFIVAGIVISAICACGYVWYSCFYSRRSSSNDSAANSALEDIPPVLATVQTLGAYDLGEVEVQVVAATYATEESNIEMQHMKSSAASAPPLYMSEATMITASPAVASRI